MKHRSILLCTVAISLPIALFLYYDNYILWWVSGFPFGYVPQTSELSTSTTVVWRCVSALEFLQYIFYGGLFAGILTQAEPKSTSLSEAVKGGSAAGFIVALLIRILHTPYNISRFPSYQWWSPGFILAILIGILIVVIFGTVSGGLGALIVYKISTRNRLTKK